MKFDELLKNQPNTRRRPRHLEEQLQALCVKWFRLRFRRYIIFAVPNGGSRNRLEAFNLKVSGVLAGVADLIIVGNKKVLFVEMKYKHGTQQDTQKQFQQRVEELGHKYVLCRSFEQFKEEVEQWVK